MEEELLAPKEMGAQVRDEMFDLFALHYDAVQRSTFEEDLSNKDFVILLRTADRKLLGFVTLSIHEMTSKTRRIRYIFSGDTVMDSDYWAPGHLLRSWFRLAGSIKAQQPKTELYWFLIVKGHRTYRILDAFFHRYAPSLTQEQDPALIGLRDKFSREKFGDYFDPSTGLITFPASRGQLAHRFQDAHDFVSRPLVQDFLKLNPNHANGVELACIAEFRGANLKSYAKTEFRKGMNAPPRHLA